MVERVDKIAKELDASTKRKACYCGLLWLYHSFLILSRQACDETPLRFKLSHVGRFVALSISDDSAK